MLLCVSYQFRYVVLFSLYAVMCTHHKLLVRVEGGGSCHPTAITVITFLCESRVFCCITCPLHLIRHRVGPKLKLQCCSECTNVTSWNILFPTIIKLLFTLMIIKLLEAGVYFHLTFPMLDILAVTMSVVYWLILLKTDLFKNILLNKKCNFEFSNKQILNSGAMIVISLPLCK